jgi:hypothetical protein
MGRTTRRILAGLLGLAPAILLLPLNSTPAGAVSPLPITCTVAGTLDAVSGPSVTQWTLVGAGSCQGDLDGTYILTDLVVQGTSDSIGLCGDSVVVNNLRLQPTGTLVNLANPLKSKSLGGQTWGAPVTTFPIATPFVITSAGGGLLGAGTIETRIFGKCPPSGGSPVMMLQFAFLT